MKWTEFSDDMSTWVLPKERAKNAKEHKLPLTPLMAEIIESVPRRDGLDLLHDSLDERLESDSTATARRERKEMFPGISLGCGLARWHQGGGGGAMAGRPPGRRTRKMLPIRKHRRRRDVARGMPPPAHRPPMLRRATGQRESASGGPDSRRDCKESFGLAFR